jgi:NAD+ synthase
MMLHQHISNWLKEYLESNKLDCFVIGVSGGIDSALTSILCAQTGKKTLVISMQIHQAKDQLQRSNNNIQFLKEKYSNVESFEFDLNNSF